MPTVLDWTPTVDPSEFVRLIRENLEAGFAVVLPGDCGYVALVNPVAANALTQLNAFASSPCILAYGSDDALALGLDVPPVAHRLMFRAWPAPLIVTLPALGARLPDNWSSGVRSCALASQRVRFRCPEHPIFQAVFPALERATLIVDTFLPTAEAVLDQLDELAGLAVSVGPRSVETRPTVVDVDSTAYTITDIGAMPAEEVQRLAARIVLFVCTGNTCRSPLAEALAKKILAERLACSVEELPARGFWMLSAGTAAWGGGPVSSESELIAAEFGADLSAHRSRPVNPQLLAAADEVIAMTAGHAQALEAYFPGIGPTARLLCDDGDLNDPIGASLDVYRDCARAIQRHLERILLEWKAP